MYAVTFTSMSFFRHFKQVFYMCASIVTLMGILVSDMYEKELRSTKYKQFLINAMSIVSNEKKRPDSDINEEYLAGSFRKLDFD